MAEVTGTATQTDLLQIRTDIASLRLATQQAKAQAESVAVQADARAREQAAENGRQATALNQRVEGLASTVTALSARLDQLTTRVEALARPAPAPRAATPPRAAHAPAAPPAASAAPRTAAPATAAPAPAAPTTAAPATAGPAPATPPPAVASIPRATTGSLQPQDIYQAAYIDFSKGSYPLAIAGFREFVRRFPEHELADNAQYWIGEALVSQARAAANAGQDAQATDLLQQAVQEFRKVLANYPRGDKAPTALYKEALVLVELKQPQLAQTRLQYLIENFPQAEEAPLARERLAALKNP